VAQLPTYDGSLSDDDCEDKYMSEKKPADEETNPIGEEETKRDGSQNIITGVVIVVLCVIAVFLLAESMSGWDWTWTGFTGGESKITITSTPQGTTIAKELQPAKSLWDWLQLFIVPVVLAIAGFWLNQMQKEREQKAIEERAKIEREIAVDYQREAALQAYINNISELLLEKHLGKLAEDGTSTGDGISILEYEQVREIARVRTLTVLPRLDKDRKRSVVQFLHESGLINRDKSIVELREADLSEACLYVANQSNKSLWIARLSGADLSEAKLYRADLRNADLSEADLSEADLSEAKLYRADLRNADLSKADLSKADLSKADLSKADLRGATVTIEQLQKAKSLEAATMPDGTIHPQPSVGVLTTWDICARI